MLVRHIRTAERFSARLSLDDVDVSVFGGQVKWADSVGIRRLRLQHGGAHVTVQEELHHL